MEQVEGNKVAMAVNGSKKGMYVVKWAVDNFSSELNTTFKLLHVRPRTTHVPTPLGNFIPLSQVREDVAAAFINEVDQKTKEMLIPYKRYFVQKKVEVEIVIIESDNVPTALASEVAKDTITKLVIGASSTGMFLWRGKYLSAKISECVPKFCTICAISKGKLISVRTSDLERNGSRKDDSSDTSSTNGSISQSSHFQTESLDPSSTISYSQFSSPSLAMQRFQALSTINQALLHKRTDSGDIKDGEDFTNNSYDSGTPIRQDFSFRSVLSDNQSWTSDQASSTPKAPLHSSSESQESTCFDQFELDKIRVELRHVRGMYAVAQSETIDASRKVTDISKRRLEEAAKLKDITLKEEKAKELFEQEKKKYEDAKREADYMRECAEKEATKRREAEMKAANDVREKEKLENALVGPTQTFKQFKWEDIVNGTSSFSENLRIGMGAFGTVYKCQLNHITTAVKVLHSKEASSTNQFQQELDVLSRIQHPHLLLLLGACPDHSCLVYEFMENGSLEDRLLRKNKVKPPIPWFDRFRIVYEVASALIFLHNAKPKPIIHRDLKPANILLDHNLVSKIGDVGLSKMFQIGDSAMSMCNNTGPVGTMCYIDPEYQRTGLNSPKSDVYAFGMVLLQILTAKRAKAITHVVETAIEESRLMEILDQQAGEWPVEETKELAIVGLGCAELRRRDRPDLKEHVMPILERLKEFADKARDAAYVVLPPPPSHFVCPILREVMNEPCVAADGYTYDRQSIEMWLASHDTSPMTNMPMPTKFLIPNYTLLSAIMEWKSNK